MFKRPNFFDSIVHSSSSDLFEISGEMSVHRLSPSTRQETDSSESGFEIPLHHRNAKTHFAICDVIF